MKDSDIRIVDIEAAFEDQRFRFPLVLSTGAIAEITYADVRIVVENRAGRSAEGFGGILLSDLWAFPEPSLDHDTKDRLMRRMVSRWRELLLAVDGYADPLQLARALEGSMPDVLGGIGREFALRVDVPELAGLVALSPFDAAVHDGWAKAAGRSAYEMYTPQYLNEDLGAYLGTGWDGAYPGDFLRPPATKLWVQHVVGGKDPLTPAEVGPGEGADGMPLALTDWIRRDRVRWLKLKIKGADVAGDLERILDVYRVAAAEAAACGIKEPVQFEIDPNEGYPDPDPAVELLRKLRERSALAFEALQYMEQPTSRNLAQYRYTLDEIAKLKPVLADESLDSLEHLPAVLQVGFNGVALKTCKGHSHALLTYCWAKRHGLHVSVQDLTNPGLSLVHSAGFCSRLGVSWDCCEANSRQYLPFSRPGEQERYPGVFACRAGQIDLASLQFAGLY